MLSEFFHIYKYLGDYRVRKILNEKIRLKTTKIFKQFDLVVPVPVSSKKRGFNQVKGIFGNSINDEYLSITKNFQMSKIDSDQRKNTEIKFEVLKDISGQKILLLDDVYTSGTTLHAVQDALLKAGAKYVESLTFAR
ncbi:MAG: ComF family protein [Lactobacillaceae bacterium]|nr:ComF family protein [Lactobacillaceae bacterium]